MPLVCSAVRPSIFRKNLISGYASAYWLTTLAIWLFSVAVDFRNFSRAGTFRNKSRTVIVVPCGRACWICRTTKPSFKVNASPTVPSLVPVVISTCATAAILASASPRKPSVAMLSRSSTLVILLVAYRPNAVSTSSAAIPHPSSVMRTDSSPPPLVSMAICPAPASSAFSNSSFTAEAGLSTTSPAAILAATWGLSTFIVILPVSYTFPCILSIVPATIFFPIGPDLTAAF